MRERDRASLPASATLKLKHMRSHFKREGKLSVAIGSTAGKQTAGNVPIGYRLTLTLTPMAAWSSVSYCIFLWVLKQVVSLSSYTAYFLVRSLPHLILQIKLEIIIIT